MTILLACGAPASDSGAVGADDALTASNSELLTIAMRLAWQDMGALKPNDQAGTNGTLEAKDADDAGNAGFQGFTGWWGDPGVPSYSVVADFTPVLVIKVLECVGCTTLIVGEKNSTTGKFEIKKAQPKTGTSINGPILGASDVSHHQVFVTSLENLHASEDPKRGNRAVTNGTYNIEMGD